MGTVAQYLSLTEDLPREIAELGAHKHHGREISGQPDLSGCPQTIDQTDGKSMN